MRSQIDHFEKVFRSIHDRSMAAAKLFPAALLFQKPPGVRLTSFGECLLRSAGSVEQAFGGITVRLWDDPFEWSLPEELSTTERIVEYLTVVETTRNRGFGYFRTDDELSKEIPAPEIIKTIHQILIETVARAEHLQGKAFAVFNLFCDADLPVR